jgi:predicted DsbA family dithiol-disulfide isomerase
VDAVVWSDYLCPWAYLGRDRTRWLEGLGVHVTRLPYDLHPELPAAGRRVSPSGRLAAVFAHIAGECAEVGLPFRPPEHLPNTRRALQAFVLVSHAWPEAAVALDDALFEAVFVHGIDLGDPDGLDRVVASVGVDAEEVRDAVDAEVAWPAVQASTATAREHGATGTPAYLLDGRLLIPGVQPRELFERCVARLEVRRPS